MLDAGAEAGPRVPAPETAAASPWSAQRSRRRKADPRDGWG